MEKKPNVSASITNIQSVWVWLASPHESLIDLGSRWRAQLVMAFSLIIALGMLGPVLMGRHDNPERNFILIGLLLIGFISYVLGRTRYYKLGSVLLVFGVASTGFALVLTGQANDASNALNTTLPLVLVIGSAVLSLRGLFFLTLFSGFGPMFLPLVSGRITAADGMIRNGGIFLVLGGLLIGINVWRDRLEKKRLDELRDANQALQVIQTTLEQRVIERTALAETARAEAEKARMEAEAQTWFTQGQAQLAEKMRGEQSIEMLANNVASYLCQYLGAQTGVLFLVSNDRLKLTGRYAYTENSTQKNEFGFGENLVGEAARANRMMSITSITDDAPMISSALGSTKPKQLLIAPIDADGQVFGVVELATLHSFSATHEIFLRRNAESIAIAFQTAQTRERIAALLQNSQLQAEELQSQEEELRAVNEELRAQTDNLKSRP